LTERYFATHSKVSQQKTPMLDRNYQEPKKQPKIKSDLEKFIGENLIK